MLKPTALLESAHDVPLPLTVQATDVLAPFLRIVNVNEFPAPGAGDTVA